MLVAGVVRCFRMAGQWVVISLPSIVFTDWGALTVQRI